MLPLNPKKAPSPLKEQWKHRAEHVNFQSKSLHNELEKAETEIERLLDGVVSASDPNVIGAFERRIKKHEQEKIVISEKLEQSGHPVKSFDEIIEPQRVFSQTLINCGLLSDLSTKEPS